MKSEFSLFTQITIQRGCLFKNYPQCYFLNDKNLLRVTKDTCLQMSTEDTYISVDSPGFSHFQGNNAAMPTAQKKHIMRNSLAFPKMLKNVNYKKKF